MSRVGNPNPRIERLQERVETLERALYDLLPGLILDLRYATEDDDRDALRSRIETVRSALKTEVKA